MKEMMEDDNTDTNTNNYYEYNLLELTVDNEAEDLENLNFECTISNYTLYIPEQTEQIILIDIRFTLNQDFPCFPDDAYVKFMELISKHHLSDSARNDILK